MSSRPTGQQQRKPVGHTYAILLCYYHLSGMILLVTSLVYLKLVCFHGVSVLYLPAVELITLTIVTCPGMILLVTSLVYLKLICFHGVSLTHKFSVFAVLSLPAVGLMMLQPHLSLDRSASFTCLTTSNNMSVNLLFSSASF